MPFMAVTVLVDNGASFYAFCDFNALPARSRGAVANGRSFFADVAAKERNGRNGTDRKGTERNGKPDGHVHGHVLVEEDLQRPHLFF